MNNLENSIALYGKISNLVYDDSLFTTNVNSITVDNKEYEIIDWIDDSISSSNLFASGFQAILLKNWNEYVIAFRGNRRCNWCYKWFIDANLFTTISNSTHLD